MSELLPYNKCVVRSLYISTEARDKSKYPHPSQFTFELPVTLKNIIGVHVQHYKYPKETLVNENNRRIQVKTPSLTGTIVLNKGDFDLIPLLNDINTKLSLYGVEFSLDNLAGRVVLTFTDEFAEYVILEKSYLLKVLGFENNICLCRNNVSPPPSYKGIVYYTTAVAENDYDVKTISDMVLRITDLEVIMSNDAITNRATMILYSNMDPNFVTFPSNQQKPMMLLQKQHRLQALRITLLNTQGELYDIGNEATFLIDIYCVPE